MAWRRWLEVSRVTEGPAFRPVTRPGHIGSDRLGDRAVSEVVKKHSARVDIDPESVSGHSLRAGLATAAEYAAITGRVATHPYRNSIATGEFPVMTLPQPEHHRGSKWPCPMWRCPGVLVVRGHEPEDGEVVICTQRPGDLIASCGRRMVWDEHEARWFPALDD